MRDLHQRVPDVAALLALEPQELAAILLFLFRTRYADGQFHLGNIGREFDGGLGREPDYPQTQVPQVKLAYMEATAWLMSQGLVIESPQDGNWRVLSRRARMFENEPDFRHYVVASRLPRDQLHATIAQRVWAEFIRGEYSNAVFLAMRQVEIAVRDGAGYDARVIGVDLMRAAFHPERGPLTDQASPIAEREARSNLFAGAIGAYKNPPSHREVDMDDPTEATEVIMFASHLLRIVNARVATRAATPT